MQLQKVYHATKYIRTSCADDETEKRDSISNQGKLIDSFLLEHPDIEAISERIDEGYSGIFFDRPAFNEMMKDIAKGKTNCVIVKDLSRLGRDYIETGRYICNIFPAYGVRFISINDNIDTMLDNGFNDMIASVKNIFNEQYSRDISVKTRNALACKRSQGEYVGANTIYGYKKCSKNKNRLIPDKNAANVVQSIFSMKLQGISAAKIAAVLNGLGILSPIEYKRIQEVPFPTGGYADKVNSRWCATTVLRILKDENYTGTLVQGRQSTYSYKTKIVRSLPENEWMKTGNAHQPIISRIDFEAVQRTLLLDTRTSPHHKNVYPFSGLLICGCCGNRMTRKTSSYKNRKYIYYYCPTGKKKGCTSPPTIEEKELLYTVMDIIKSHIRRIGLLEALIHGEQLSWSGQSEYTVQIAKYEKRIQECNLFKSHLYQDLIDGIISKEECDSYKEHYTEEILRLHHAIADIRKKVQRIGVLAKENTEWLQNLKQYENLQELDRQSVVRMIHSICITRKKELQIRFNYQDEYEQAVRFTKLGLEEA